MVKKLGLVALLVCLGSLPAFSQSLQQDVIVRSGTAGGALCQSLSGPVTTKVTVSVSGLACSWNDGANSGSGSATATSDYGILQANGTAVASISTPTATANTQTEDVGVFEDSLSFPALTTNATLVATLSVSVGESVSGSGVEMITADVNLNGAQFGQCIIQVAKGTCTTSIPVMPGDFVPISGELDVVADAGFADAGFPGPTGSATFTGDNKKSFGARWAFALVNSAGHAIKVPIVSASGTTYPTK